MDSNRRAARKAAQAAQAERVRVARDDFSATCKLCDSDFERRD